MNWLARVYVLPKAEVLDPQGVAILGALRHLSFDAVASVRSGRLFHLHIINCNQETAERVAGVAAQRLLANTVVETYEVTIEPLPDAVVAAEAVS